MRKVVLNLAVSLDGYISRENGSVDWLNNLETGDSDLGFQEFLSRCDTILMGRKSFEDTLELSKGEWIFKDLNTFVFTSRKIKDKRNINFVSDDPLEIVSTIRKQRGKDIWLFGGGNFISSMRDANLVDEYIITIIPTFIGKGIRLFQDSTFQNNLKLLSTKRFSDIIQCHYKVIRK